MLREEGESPTSRAVRIMVSANTRLPNTSLLQAAGPFMHSCQAGICGFKSAWNELNLNACVSSKSPNVEKGSHSHLTAAETPRQGAEARLSPPNVHLFKQLNASEGLKQLSLLRYSPLPSSDRACKQLLPAPSAPDTVQSPLPRAGTQGSQPGVCSDRGTHTFTATPNVHGYKQAELTGLSPSGSHWWGFSHL